MSETRSIWIDLDNSPHVPLFVPIIRHYRENDVEVILTARDHSQTIELLNLAGLTETFTVIGRHYGVGKFNKIRGALVRAVQLATLIMSARSRPAVAVSHGSRSMVLAAKLLGIPIITMYDYEFTETKIFNRFSDLVIVPDTIPDKTLDEIGLPKEKRRKYIGIKEELYVNYFEPNSNMRADLFSQYGIADHDGLILVVLRPPASDANYHSEHSEVLLAEVFRYLTNAPNVVTVIVPRTSKQQAVLAKEIAGMPGADARMFILNESVDGLQLAHAADIVISGGGTMNREAALLGVPVYSIFAGKQGALDRQMEADGRIVFIRDASDVSKIRLASREHVKSDALTDRVERFLIDQIDAFL